SAGQLVISRGARIAKAMKELWDDSLAVALTARDLAARSGQDTEMDTAYVCGLFHDLGKPIVASVLLEAEKAVTTERGGGWIGSDFWLEVVNQAHRRVGIALAEKWMLPDEAVQGIKGGSEYDSGPRHSPAHFVRLANAAGPRAGI